MGVKKKQQMFESSLQVLTDIKLHYELLKDHLNVFANVVVLVSEQGLFKFKKSVLWKYENMKLVTVAPYITYSLFRAHLLSYGCRFGS